MAATRTQKNAAKNGCDTNKNKSAEGIILPRLL
jgi:hypothetical protein